MKRTFRFGCVGCHVEMDIDVEPMYELNQMKDTEGLKLYDRLERESDQENRDGTITFDCPNCGEMMTYAD